MDTLEITPAPGPVAGAARVPGSKSITNRARVLAALAPGPPTRAGAVCADDTRRMADCLGALGFAVHADPAAHAITVDGQGGRIPAARAELFVGNSGTTARFVTPLVALGRGEFVIDGVPRMRERPMADLLRALAQLDVEAASTGTGCPPIHVRARGLRGGACTVRADSSSQFLSGLLMAAPCADGDETRIRLEGPILSAPYVGMTVAMLRQFGARVDVEDEGRTYVVPGRQTLRGPGSYPVEPDASAASYFLAAAAVTNGRVRIPGVGSDILLQGDWAFADVLAAMGCRVTRGGDWVEVAGAGTLHGVSLDMNAISDTVMTLAAVAPFADSPTVIENVGHIRHKETDRLAAVAAELGRLGVRVEERPDGLTIHPAGRITPAVVQTYDDHRMAMGFALIGLRAPGVRIADPGCVAKTFPDYFARLSALVEGHSLPPGE